MSWTQSLWARLQSLGFAVFVAIVGCGVVLLFLPLLRQRHVMQQEILRLDTELAKQEQIEKQQKSEMETLKSDSTYLERTAREKLNLARPNETIFRFETPTTTTSSSTATRAPQPHR